MISGITKCLAVLLVCAAGIFSTTGHAQETGLNGTFQMTNNTITINLFMQATPDGKYIVNADGNTADGKFCRVGDKGILSGSQLAIGGCSAGIRLTQDGFDLNDANNCFHCDAGLSASGSYKRK